MNFKVWLEATKEDFWNLAYEQRDIPEKAMLKVQFAMGGGIMNSAAEHIGDIIHRMSERPTFPSAGYEYVKDKVDKTYNWLTNGYGFEREFEENIKNNARYKNIPENEYRNKVYEALKEYADAHAKLPVYNQAQKLAQEAATSLGNRYFLRTTNALRQLKKHLGSKEEWVKFAHEGLDES